MRNIWVPIKAGTLFRRRFLGYNPRMGKYILAIDQGTTSTRAILLDGNGKGIAKACRNLECLFPKPGWVEEDAEKIWISVVDVINEILILEGISFSDIAAIGLTNQRETTVVWDKRSGKPIYNAIVWQSRQTQDLCEKKEDLAAFMKEKTGLPLNPYFSASKIRFILDSVEGAQEEAEKGHLLFGTIDSWLIYKLTKGTKHLTDITNASRTMLYNIYDLKWDEELLRIWNIPASMLPEVKGNAEDFGEASFFPHHVHIHGVAGDQQSALFGQACYRKGESKNTYGTGCFMLMNTGLEPIRSKKGLLTTIAWKLDDEVTYALEGSVFMGGAIVQWIRDELGWIKSSADSEEYAKRKPDTAGVYVVPAFVGLGTPYWNDEARGTILGLTRGADRHNITRAALYSIAYQSKDVIETMKEEACLALPSLKVDGGASANDLLMQFQSDILQTEVAIPESVETTALGAGYLAGLGVGFFPSLAFIEKSITYKKRFVPQMSKKEMRELYRGWKKAVKATLAFKVEE